MKPVLALSLAPLGAGWAFGAPDCLKPASGFVAFGNHLHSDDEIGRNCQSKVFGLIKDLGAEVVAVTAVPDGPATARRLYDLQVAVRLTVKGMLPGSAKLIDMGEALESFTGMERHATRADADRAMKMECRRRLWLSMDDIESDRCAALAIWCHVAAQQLPELAFNPPRKRA